MNMETKGTAARDATQRRRQFPSSLRSLGEEFSVARSDPLPSVPSARSVYPLCEAGLAGSVAARREPNAADPTAIATT